MEGGVTWAALGYVIGILGVALGAYLRATAIFASSKDHEALKAEVEKHKTTDEALHHQFVTRETLELQLRPIREELEHRKRSMDTLARSFAALQATVHRMDKALVAIATKLNVDVAEEDPKEQENA